MTPEFWNTHVGRDLRGERGSLVAKGVHRRQGQLGSAGVASPHPTAHPATPDPSTLLFFKHARQPMSAVSMSASIDRERKRETERERERDCK